MTHAIEHEAQGLDPDGFARLLEDHHHRDNGAGIVTCRCGYFGVGWNTHFSEVYRSAIQKALAPSSEKEGGA